MINPFKRNQNVIRIKCLRAYQNIIIHSSEGLLISQYNNASKKEFIGSSKCMLQTKVCHGVVFIFSTGIENVPFLGSTYTKYLCFAISGRTKSFSTLEMSTARVEKNESDPTKLQTVGFRKDSQ